jgi:hypothetical protein
MVWVVCLAARHGSAAEEAAKVMIDFSRTLRAWDGFGLNYIEAGHTADPEKDYEDYGGFSRLSEAKRQEIMDLLYGPLDPKQPDHGLRLGLHKIFLDPHHQSAPDAPFVGANRITEMSRYFMWEAAKRLKARGQRMEVLTTYYGAPAWATSTGKFHWRDINPERMRDLADYMSKWVVYLRREVKERGFEDVLRISAVGVTNEGEFPERWNDDGSPKPGNDYNLFWPTTTLAKFLPVLAASLKDHGVGDALIMPTETGGWDFFAMTRMGDPVASTLLRDPAARASIGIIGSHSFGPSTGPGAAALGMFRGVKGEDLRAWTTSHDWRTGDLALAESTRVQVREIGVNGIITWAATKRVADWQRYTNRPPNPQCAVLVNDDGTTRIQSGYYFLKHTSLAGQPGMAVAWLEERPSRGVRALAFSGARSGQADAFVLMNPTAGPLPVEVQISGSAAKGFRTVRTVEGLPEGEVWRQLGATLRGADGVLRYLAPARSITTFFAE